MLTVEELKGGKREYTVEMLIPSVGREAII
jgi:hypothetical protein